MTTLNNLDYGVPGYRTSMDSTPDREFLWSVEHLLWKPAGGIIDASKSRDPLNTGNLGVLRAGMLMGKRTSNGYYAPAILGLTTVAYADNDVALTVGVATAVEIVRRIGATGTFKLTGPPTAAGTVATVSVTYTAVNVTTGVITVPDLNAAFVAGSLVRPADGSETIKGILGANAYVLDYQAAEVNARMPKLAISGCVRGSQLLNWPADTSLQAFIRSALNDPASGPGPFWFDGNF